MADRENHKLARAFFGAHGQLGVGVFVFLTSVAFWVMGTVRIKGAATLPWDWTTGVFIFHASMFALLLASYGIVSGALGYRATERVEAKVVENIDHANTVEVGNH